MQIFSQKYPNQRLERSSLTFTLLPSIFDIQIIIYNPPIYFIFDVLCDFLSLHSYWSMIVIKMRNAILYCLFPATYKSLYALLYENNETKHRTQSYVQGLALLTLSWDKILVN